MTYTTSELILAGVAGVILGWIIEFLVRLFVPSRETEKWKRLHSEEVAIRLQTDKDHEQTCKAHRTKNEALQISHHEAVCDRDDWKGRYEDLRTRVSDILGETD